MRTPVRVHLLVLACKHLLVLSVLSGCSRHGAGTVDPFCLVEDVDADSAEALLDLTKLEHAALRAAYVNSIKAAQRRFETLRLCSEAAPSSEGGVCPGCRAEAFNAMSPDGSPVAVRLVRPDRRPEGLLLIVDGEEETFSSEYTASLVKNGIAVATMRVAAGRNRFGPTAAEDAIAAAREISIRGYAAPHNLFLKGRGAAGWIAARAAAARPELFRGAILEHLPAISAEAVDPVLGFTDYRFSVDTLIVSAADTPTDVSVTILEWMRRARCSRTDPPSVVLAPQRSPDGANSREESDRQRALEEAFVLVRVIP